MFCRLAPATRYQTFRSVAVVPDTARMVTSLVVSRMGYENAVSMSLPAYQLGRLLSILNTSARLIFDLHSPQI
jgi:hypothetical protein